MLVDLPLRIEGHGRVRQQAGFKTGFLVSKARLLVSKAALWFQKRRVGFKSGPLVSKAAVAGIRLSAVAT